MSEQDKKRRSAILASLSFDPVSSVRTLRQDIEHVHGIVASADLIRADLTWLQEMGLVRFDGEAARCTERGMDVARFRAKFPGDV